jgi:hypothetical protein
MTQSRILLVGYPQGLDIRLQHDDYEVIIETDPTRALDKLRTEWFHLSIVYLPKKGGKIDGDMLSLALAIDKPYPQKIIILSDPLDQTSRMICQALTNLDGTAPAVALVSEQDGLDAVMRAVKNSIKRYSNINQQLVIQPNIHVLERIASHIKPNTNPTQWVSELHELLCMLFHDCSSIRLELPSHLQDRKGNIATVWVQPTSRNIPQEHPVLVTCGSRERVAQIRESYETYLFRVTGLRMAGHAETMNFASVAYPAPSDRSDIYDHDFTDFYLNKIASTAAKDIGLAISDYFNQAHKLWYRVRQPDGLEKKSLRSWYIEHLLVEDEKKMKSLLEHTIGDAGKCGVRIQLKQNSLGVAFSTSAKYEFYPNPVHHVYRGNIKFLNSNPSLLRIGHWDLRGSNLCVTKENVVVLSGYENLEWGPGVGDVAGMETLLKFHCQEHNRLFDLYNLEKRIFALESFDELPDQTSMDPTIQKTMEWVAHLRTGHARGLSSYDLSYYYANLFYFAMREFVSESATDLQRLHALLSAAIICYRLENWDTWKGWPDDPNKWPM